MGGDGIGKTSAGPEFVGFFVGAFALLMGLVFVAGIIAIIAKAN